MSYDFDGSGSANLNVATPIAALPLTMACWGKANVDAASAIMMCLGNATDSEIFRMGLHFESAGDPARLRRTNSGGTADDTTSSTGAMLDTWHHVCATVASATSAAIYIDGGSKVTDATSRNITGATRLAIGAQYQAGAYGIDTDGQIAHVAIWDIALSDAEVASLAAGANPLAVQAANLVAYWPLTADLVDVVGALTLTNGGGATLSGDNPTVDAPPADSITPDDVAVAVTIEQPGLTAGGAITPDDVSVAVTLDAATIQVLVLEPDNTDSDSYDTMTTEVIGDTLYLEGFYDGDGFGGWVNTKARVSGGVNGATYNVVLDATGKQTAGAPAGNNNTTGDPWTPVIRGKVAGVWGAYTKLSGYGVATNVVSGSFTWPTGATEVEVSYKPVVLVAEVMAFFTEMYASAHVSEPTSAVTAAIAEGIHATLAYGDGPNSVGAGNLNYPCAKFGTGPRIGVVTLCTHAQEGVGDLSAFQFIRWALGSSSEAIAFRARFTVYVYAHNLSGRLTGKTRFDSDVGTDDDPNRAWDDSNSEQTVALRSAIETYDIPLATAIAWWLDYHGQQDANVLTAAYDIYTNTDYPADMEFHDRMALAVGSQVHEQATASSALSTGSTKWYARTQRSAPLAVVIEHADAAAGYPDAATMHDTFAAATGATLVDMADDGYFADIPLTVAYVAVSVSLDSPSLTSGSSITPADMAVAVAVDAAAIDAMTSISPADMAVAVTLDQPTIAATSTVAPADVAVAVSLDAATLSADGNLVPADMAVAVALDSPTLSATTSVAPADVAVAVTLDAATLTSGASLTVADLSVAVALDSPTLTATSTVAPNDMTVGVSLDQAVLAMGGNRPPPHRRMNVGTWDRRIAA